MTYQFLRKFKKLCCNKTHYQLWRCEKLIVNKDECQIDFENSTLLKEWTE